VENVSNESGIVDSAKIYFPESIVDLPFGVVSSGEILEYEGIFKFDLLGPKTGLTRVFTQDNCTPIQIPVKANVVAPRPGFAGSNELELLDCESSNIDTIRIRNFGEGILNIKSVNSNNPNVSVSVIDEIINPQSTGRLEIEYTLENPGLDSVDIFIQTNIQEDFTESTYLKIFFKRIDTDYLINKSEFIFVEPLGEQELNIQNRSERKLEIFLPETNDFDFLPDDKEILLLPGDQHKIRIIANEIDAPIPDRKASTTINLLGFCDTKEIIINSDFSGRVPVISSFEEVDFGNISCNQDTKDTLIVIENVGNAELTLNNIRLEGEQSANFQIIDNAPRLIEAGETEEFMISFLPSNEFINNAIFIAETNSLQNSGVLEIPITVNYLDSEYQIDQSEVVIDDLEFNTPISFEIEIENMGNLPASISLNLEFNSGVFVIDSISNNPPAPGETSTIYLKFQGGDIDEKYETVLSILDDCGKEYRKRFEINVIGTRNFDISVGDFTGRPGDLLELPILVSNPQGSKLPENGNYSATISFNSTLLHSSASFTGVENGRRWLAVSGNLNEELSGETELLTELLVTLGNSESTDISIDAEFDNALAYKFNSKNGSFAYTQDYIMDNPGLVDGTISIDFQGPNPNPVQQEFYISFNMIEEGNCTIELIDSNGKRIRTIVNEELRTGFKEYNFNSLELSSGFYFLHFRTPTYSKLVPFTVVN
jgi:hypothetical protein